MTTEDWRDRRVPRYERKEPALSVGQSLALLVGIALFSAAIGGLAVWMLKDGIKAFFGW